MAVLDTRTGSQPTYEGLKLVEAYGRRFEVFFVRSLPTRV